MKRHGAGKDSVCTLLCCGQRFTVHPAVLWAKKAAEKNVAHVLESWKCSELLKDHIGQEYAINVTKKKRLSYQVIFEELSSELSI